MNTIGKEFQLLKEILRKIKYSYKAILTLLIAMAVAFVTTMMRPLIVSRLTDYGLAEGDYNIVVLYSFVLIVISLINYFNDLFQSVLFINMANQMEKELYLTALNKILKASYSSIKKRTSVELFSTIYSDISRITLLMDRSCLMSFFYCFQIIGGIIGLLFLEWRVALLIFGAIPIKLFITFKFSKRQTHLTKDYLSEWKKFSEWFGDQINGVAEIKLWNLYDIKEKNFFQKYSRIPIVKEKIELCNCKENIIGIEIGHILEVIVYLGCGYLLCRNKMSMGDLIAFLSYVTYILSPLDFLANIPYLWSQIKPSVERYISLTNWPEEKLIGIKKGDIGKFNIVFKNVSYQYTRGVEVLKNVNLLVKQGEKIAIIGDNGTGKTTFIRLLLGLILPKSGNIYLDDKRSSDIGLSEWRKYFALVGQTVFLFSDSIKNNIDLSQEMSLEELRKIIDTVGIEVRHNNIGTDYEYIIKENGSNLSGGEKQKICILRAITKKAPIIVLDEPYSQCDEESRKILRKAVLQFGCDNTVILVSHYREDLEDFDRIYELKNGYLYEH